MSLSTEHSDLEAAIGALARHLGCDPGRARPTPVAGGSINRAFKIAAGGTPLFLKLNAAPRYEMFDAEAEGLRALKAAGAVRVPEVVAYGRAGSAAYLALEWLDLGGTSVAAERRFGRLLAVQHRVTAASHGWHRDNTIGVTPQPNAQDADWTSFFCEQRLGFQLCLAVRNGLPREAEATLSRLIEAVPRLLAGHEPEPALLHGDLWGGNMGTLRDSTPVIFDPAVYFGDRETDLAMTRLFGGFGQAFYEAYSAEYPLPSGWQRRTPLYNLYHLLNHFNLFGSEYLGSVCSTAEHLLGDVQ